MLTAATRLVEAHQPRALEQPFGLSELVSAIDLAQRGCAEIVLAGDASDPRTIALERALATSYLPNRMIAHATEDSAAPAALAALLEGKRPGPNGAPRAYVCRDFACEAPEESADGLAARLRG